MLGLDAAGKTSILSLKFCSKGYGNGHTQYILQLNRFAGVWKPYKRAYVVSDHWSTVI